MSRGQTAPAPPVGGAGGAGRAPEAGALPGPGSYLLAVGEEGVAQNLRRLAASHVGGGPERANLEQFAGDGVWYGTNDFVEPRSLYYAQLADRLGSGAADRADLMRVLTDGSTSPSVEEAAELTAAAREPAPLLSDWIDDASRRRPISTDAGDARSIEEVRPRAVADAPR